MEENIDTQEKKPKIKSLLITNRMPYPPIGGGPLRNWQNVTILMELGSVAIFFISLSNDKDLSSIARKPPGTVFLSQHEVNDYPAKGISWLAKVRALFQPRKHTMVDNQYRKEIDVLLGQVLRDYKPNLVIFDDPWLYRYLNSVKLRGCLTILDEHNIEAPLYVDKRKSAGATSRIKSRLDSFKLQSIEKDFIHQVDQIWTCSDSDVSLAQALYGDSSKIRIIPNGVNVSEYDYVRLENIKLPSEHKHNPWVILFPANFGYVPNKAASELLIEEIFPQLQVIFPQCKLVLAGRSPTPFMLAAAEENPGVIVTGLIEDMLPYLAWCSVMIVPLRTGGGTRLKILEAFAACRPVVTTSKGAEGLKAQNNHHLLIRDNVDEIVSGVCQLWDNPSLSRRLVQHAYELVQNEYSWTSLSQTVEKNLREIDL